MVFLSQEQKVDGKGRLGIAGFTVVDSCRQKNKDQSSEQEVMAFGFRCGPGLSSPGVWVLPQHHPRSKHTTEMPL